MRDRQTQTEEKKERKLMISSLPSLANSAFRYNANIYRNCIYSFVPAHSFIFYDKMRTVWEKSIHKRLYFPLCR